MIRAARFSWNMVNLSFGFSMSGLNPKLELMNRLMEGLMVD
nr:MAG TPA: hypothetical protein [Caudoviricetes sp.]